MAISQRYAERKVTGGRYVRTKVKKLAWLGSDPTLTKLGAMKKTNVRTRGGGIKTRLLDADMANVVDPKSGKHKMVKIVTVMANPANINYVRRNILTKGAIIQTELGKAKITSRPGQEGTVNAILVAE